MTSQKKKRVVNEEFLEDVAAVYRDAVARRYPPTKALIERFGSTTPENARRWIQRARDEGKLGPARARKAGRAAVSALPNSIRLDKIKPHSTMKPKGFMPYRPTRKNIRTVKRIRDQYERMERSVNCRGRGTQRWRL